MTKSVQEQIHLLRVLLKANQQVRKSIIRKAGAKLVQCLCECAFNTVRGNVKLTPTQKKKLAAYKNILFKLAAPKKTLKHRKTLLLQKGGAFLPLLLAPIIGSLVSHLFPSSS